MNDRVMNEQIETTSRDSCQQEYFFRLRSQSNTNDVCGLEPSTNESRLRSQGTFHYNVPSIRPMINAVKHWINERKTSRRQDTFHLLELDQSTIVPPDPSQHYLLPMLSEVSSLVSNAQTLHTLSSNGQQMTFETSSTLSNVVDSASSMEHVPIVPPRLISRSFVQTSHSQTLRSSQLSQDRLQRSRSWTRRDWSTWNSIRARMVSRNRDNTNINHYSVVMPMYHNQAPPDPSQHATFLGQLNQHSQSSSNHDRSFTSCRNISRIQQALHSFRAPSSLAHDNCPICLASLCEQDITATQCCHIMHAPCLVQWILSHSSCNCPVCRSPIQIPVLH